MNEVANHFGDDPMRCVTIHEKETAMKNNIHVHTEYFDR